MKETCNRGFTLTNQCIRAVIHAWLLVNTVLGELGKGKDTQRMMSDVWSRSRTLRVKRVRPFTTAAGKLLPLHIGSTLRTER